MAGTAVASALQSSLRCNVKGRNGGIRGEMAVTIYIIAVRERGKWRVRAERAHFQ